MATVIPEEKGLVALARYIRETGRAYPLVDIAKAMLNSRDRYALRFEKLKDEGEAGTKLIRCALDGSLWTSREDALRHATHCEGIGKYYRVDEVTVDPPKGNFQVVAVHEQTGTILGPPNHHEYQSNLAQLHRERFSHVPFDRFTRMVEMRRDEETLEKWKELKSRQLQYTYVFGQEQEVEAPAEEAPEAGAEAETGGVPDAVAGEAGGADEGEAGVTAEEASVVEESAIPGGAEGEVEMAVADETGGGAAADVAAEDSVEETEAVPEQVVEAPPASDKLVFKTEQEMVKHFASVHGDEVLEEVRRAVVHGDIPGRNLSAPLLSLLRQTVDEQRKFPSGLIQQLCRSVEKYGLKIFKEGKKKLHVSPARPRRLDPDAKLSEAIEKIVKFVGEHPGAKVVDLLEAIIPEYKRPEGDSGEWKPSKEELGVLRELHWLTSQGYVIEFSSSKLRLGGVGPGEPRDKKKEERARKPEGRGGGQQKAASKVAGGTASSVVVDQGGEGDAEAMRLVRARRRRRRRRRR